MMLYITDKHPLRHCLFVRSEQNQTNGLNLTVAPLQRSCPLPAPAPVHPGSSGLCAAASGRTAASGWCTDPGRTSPAGRPSQMHDGRNAQSTTNQLLACHHATQWSMKMNRILHLGFCFSTFLQVRMKQGTENIKQQPDHWQTDVRTCCTSFMVKTSLVAPACCSKVWNSTFGLTWTHTNRKTLDQNSDVRTASKEVSDSLHSLVCCRQWRWRWPPCQLTSWSWWFLHRNRLLVINICIESTTNTI